MADGAVVIDLSLMKGVRVDPEKADGTVQAGVLLGDLDRETQAFGLAVPSGIVTHTGVAGLTSAAGSAGSCVSTGCRSTSSSQSISSRPTVSSSRRARIGTRSLLGSPRRRRQLRDRH
jgi:hypothetical protein